MRKDRDLSEMNIWICNPFDLLPWEGGAQRYASLAASLAEQGHGDAPPGLFLAQGVQCLANFVHQDVVL